jgi:hypothetical protein
VHASVSFWRGATIGNPQLLNRNALLSFQIVSIDAPASGVVLAGSARLREASRLLVTKKKKNGLAPLSRFQHDGVRDAITETLFLV